MKSSVDSNSVQVLVHRIGLPIKVVGKLLHPILWSMYVMAEIEPSVTIIGIT